MVVDPDEKGPMWTWEHVALCPGADRVLECLSKLHSCYLVTNAVDSGRDDIEKALARVGIDHYVTGIFCYKNTGYKKPSKEYFNVILKRLNCLPETIIMIGDDLINDYLWAMDNGAKAILYDPKYQYEGQDVVRVVSLTELCDISFYTL